MDLHIKLSTPRAPRLNERSSLKPDRTRATNRRLVILGTKHDKAEYPAKMRDNYCHHLNQSHRETLLSSHLKYELLRMAHKVTGTGHPFLQSRKGESHIMAGHDLYQTKA